jgi:hypothetical protein
LLALNPDQVFTFRLSSAGILLCGHHLFWGRIFEADSLHEVVIELLIASYLSTGTCHDEVVSWIFALGSGLCYLGASYRLRVVFLLYPGRLLDMCLL